MSGTFFKKTTAHSNPSTGASALTPPKKGSYFIASSSPLDVAHNLPRIVSPMRLVTASIASITSDKPSIVNALICPDLSVLQVHQAIKGASASQPLAYACHRRWLLRLMQRSVVRITRCCAADPTLIAFVSEKSLCFGPKLQNSRWSLCGSRDHDAVARPDPQFRNAQIS